MARTTPDDLGEPHVRIRTYLPPALSLITLLIQLVAQPTGSIASLAMSFTMTGISFDIWAIQTIASGRLATWGGQLDFPSFRDEHRKANIIAIEVTRIAVLVASHILLLVRCAAETHSEKFPPYLGLGALLLGVLAPFFLVGGGLRFYTDEQEGYL